MVLSCCYLIFSVRRLRSSSSSSLPTPSGTTSGLDMGRLLKSELLDSVRTTQHVQSVNNIFCQGPVRLETLPAINLSTSFVTTQPELRFAGLLLHLESIPLRRVGDFGIPSICPGRLPLNPHGMRCIRLAQGKDINFRTSGMCFTNQHRYPVGLAYRTLPPGPKLGTLRVYMDIKIPGLVANRR